MIYGKKRKTIFNVDKLILYVKCTREMVLPLNGQICDAI